MEKPVVIVIDMLNDFVKGDLKSPRAQAIVPKIRSLIEAARRCKVPVVYSNDAHFKEDIEVVHRWGKHAIKGTKGAEVISELEPQKSDYVIEKRTYSGFYETGLEPLLRSLYKGEGARTIILTGLHTNICVRHTAADAFFRGYKIVVAKDGVEAFTPKEHEEGLKYLEYAYRAEIKTVKQIIKSFS